jgi:hypothetical protein
LSGHIGARAGTETSARATMDPINMTLQAKDAGHIESFPQLIEI